jgi:putative ABC transport system permease protein
VATAQGLRCTEKRGELVTEGFAFMPYSLTTLWHERQRYLPAVLAVAFSALLTILQCGLVLGIFALMSTPIDHSRADIWVGGPCVLSVDMGQEIPETYLLRVANQPEVERVELLLQDFRYWAKPKGGLELCIVIGSRLDDNALGAVRELTPDLRLRLTEPGAIVVDEGELGRLGIRGVGDMAEIGKHRVRVVGLVHGVRSLSGPYVFCSIPTARALLQVTNKETTYILARCHDRADAPAVVERLRAYPTMSAFTSLDFSRRSQVHWLADTKAGVALGCSAFLGLLVGAVVTSQTLYAATAAARKEYAVLRALGVPRWRMAGLVMAQAAWVGIAGLGLAGPLVFGLYEAASAWSVPVQLPIALLSAAAVLTMTVAMLSGVVALSSLRWVEPAVLLR